MAFLDRSLQGRRVFVSGATGFVGSRLAFRLAKEEEANVTGTGRNLDKVSFLKEAGVTLQLADMTDTAAMRRLMTDQEVVFHVAGWLGTRTAAKDRAYTFNVTATENLVRLSVELGVKRFVLVSTIAVYGAPNVETVDEATPLNLTQSDLYGRTKAEGEQRALQLANELGLALSIVRPGMVYGPGAPAWTLNMYRQVNKGTPVIFGDGNGYAHPLYIDNLVDGMLLASVRPKAVGEAFNLVDHPISWHKFFGYYGSMAGREPRRIPMWLARLLAIASESLNLGLPLSRERLGIYVSKSTYDTSKAKDLLGYRSRVDIDEGMAQGESWLRAEGYLGD